MVTVWLVISAVAGATGRQSSQHAGHDVEEAVEAAAKPPAASLMSSNEDCWEDYVQRAIQIYMNLTACVKENEWYDTFGYLICELSYEFGAFMAFMRLLACMNT